MSTTPLYAQQAQNQTQNSDPDSEIIILPPAYDQQMMELAETLGALHFLRELCNANEGQLWREQIEKMLEKEAPIKQRKARLIARFNRGFRGYREIFRRCTPAATLAANRQRNEAARLISTIVNRYGN